MDFLALLFVIFFVLGARPRDARLHGDPFPLLVPEVLRPADLSDAPRYVAQRTVRRSCRERRVRRAVWSLNYLASDTVCGQVTPARGAARPEANATQRAVVGRLRGAVGYFSSRRADFTPNGAWCELLNTDSLYVAPACKFEGYDENKVKFLQSDITPRPIGDLAPDSVKQPSFDPDCFFRKSDEAVERDVDGNPPVGPYWDE